MKCVCLFAIYLRGGETWGCLFPVNNIYTPRIQTCSDHREQGIKLKGALQHI